MRLRTPPPPFFLRSAHFIFIDTRMLWQVPEALKIKMGWGMQYVAPMVKFTALSKILTKLDVFKSEE